MAKDFFEGQWIEVFRAGDQTDSSGNTRKWTDSDLKKIVKLYSEQTDHEAPLVIGHPKDNDPAYGWVEALKTDGKMLYAQFKQVAKGMSEAVETGLLKKRSISLYPNLLLRHIGFLGAVPPAVKGLADIQYKEEDNLISIEYSENEEGDNSMSKELIDKIAAMEAAQVVAQKEFSDKLKIAEDTVVATKAQFEEATLKNKELDEQIAKFNEDKNPPKKTAFEEATDARIKAMEIELEAAKRQNRISDHREFVTGLHAAGKVVTEQQGVLIDLMESVHGNEEFNFSDGKASVISKFKSYLQAQPALVTFGESDTDKTKKGGAESAADQLDKIALGFCEADKSMSYSEAFTAAQEKNPELANKAALEI